MRYEHATMPSSAMRLAALMVLVACREPTPAPAATTAVLDGGASSAAPATTTQPTSALAAVRPYLWFSARSARAPLVLFLHGYGASPAQAAEALGLAAVAQALDVHIAAPEGTPDRQGLRFWNAGPACCDFDRTGIDDVATLTAVLEDASRRHPVTARYVVGFSNGAFMAHRLGCAASDRIDGFVAFAGVGPQGGVGCHPTRPLHVLQVHGTRDRAVDYEGGTVLGRSDVEPHPGAEATLRFWAAHDGCTEERQVAPPHPISGKPVTALTWNRCEGGRRVALWTITGGGHLTGIDQPTVSAAIRFLLGPT